MLFREVFVFFKSDFHILSYCYVFTFILLGVIINYQTGFYQNVMRNSYFTGDSVWMFPLFYSLMYFAAIIPALLLQKDQRLLRNRKFYIKSLFIIILYGVSIGYYGYAGWTFNSLPGEEKMFAFKIISQLKGSAFFIAPVYLLKVSYDKHVEGIYGLGSNTKHIPAYLVLFLALLPFIIGISFTPDFRHAYPQFHPWRFGEVFGMPLWLNTFLYEITYGIDFLKTELIFRGLLVIGMAKIMGKKSVLPMAAMYVAIHFGKPLGETLSSIFGGYILGALAYQTRHIWGGVIVHICIALSMEIMGFVQFYLLGNNP